MAQKGKALEALQLIATFSPSLQRDRSVLLTRLRLAKAVGRQEYAAVLTDLERIFPNDPWADLVRLDGCYLQKKYDEGLKFLDRLGKTVGEDAYLHFLRGHFWLAKADPAKAKEWWRRAVAFEPGLMDPYRALLGLSLQEKDFRQTAQWLTAVEKNAGAKVGDLKEHSEYAEFVKSKEYEEWLTSREKPNEPQKVEGQTKSEEP